ncbi:hypothetical protein [Sulfitobacter sp. S190]|uniref:hypothetical protein n=1 Tax=Sulfitobacter sp. S190 TaxID=2867022 RepID=UPI0021A70953|nr:hypothetical protein [Sulfitobacter sp. S190]UWR21112.1 hypothetical protein K3756_10295 [Sulfitobacter sp. S190]
MSIHNAKILKAAMQIVEESDNWCEATIESNGHAINLADGFDQDLLEVLAHHKPTLSKLDDLASLLSDILEDLREKPPMTDAQALSEIEEAKRILDKHYDSGFLIGVWHEQLDGVSYRYAKDRYDELAQRDSEGEAD